MSIMGFFVFIENYLATSGNHENGFVDGKNDGTNLGAVKINSAIPAHRLRGWILSRQARFLPRISMTKRTKPH
jgi:hypothetical protein